MKKLYRVENIIRTNSRNNLPKIAQVVLEVIPDNLETDNELEDDFNFDDFLTINVPETALKLATGSKLRENMFVYYDKDSQTFTKASNDERAKALTDECDRLRELLIRNSMNI